MNTLIFWQPKLILWPVIQLFVAMWFCLGFSHTFSAINHAFSYVINVIHNTVANGTGGEIMRGREAQNCLSGLWV
jgi:hypothetical protein